MFQKLALLLARWYTCVRAACANAGCAVPCLRGKLVLLLAWHVVFKKVLHMHYYKLYLVCVCVCVSVRTCVNLMSYAARSPAYTASV